MEEKKSMLFSYFSFFLTGMLSSDRNPTNYPAFVKVFFFQIASIEQTQTVDIGGMGRGETPHREYIKYTFGAPKDLLY